MQKPEIHPRELERIAALHALKLLDSEDEHRFDVITRFAVEHFRVPVAMVSLVDSERQWFKSCIGQEVRETSRDVSFCGHTILGAEPFVVEDARQDPRFADNPLVTGESQVVFYAGYPMFSLAGLPLGSFCVVDHQPRTLTEDDLVVLAGLARWAENELNRDAVARLSEDLQVRNRFFESSVDLFCVAGIASRRFVMLNPRWQELLGYSHDELMAKPITEFVHPDDVARTSRELDRLAAGDRSVNFETRFRTVDHSWVVLQWVAESYPEEDRIFASARDITLLRSTEFALIQSLARMEAVLETAVDSIIVIDENGTIESANSATSSMFGYPVHELVGQNVRMVMPEPYADQHDGYLERYRSTGVRRIIGIGREVEGRRRDGSTFPVELSIAEMTLDGRRHYSGILRDISERRRLERVKQEFISTVSHELRTPLTAIRGSLGLVQGGVAGEVPPQAAQMIDMAVTNSDRLVRLINDLLDIEKIESGNIVFTMADVRVADLARRAVAANQGYAIEHETSFRLSLADDVADDLIVHGDDDRLVQVMSNLLSNAAKHSPAGVPVDVSVTRTPTEVCISVADRGEGIPVAFRSRVFEKFAQADSSDTRKRGGTGLGLSIARAIVERHGGSIGFETEAGRGTTFWFKVPIRVGARSTDATNQFAAPVLIVEDDPDFSEVLASTLRGEGYDVTLVHDAESARHVLERRAFSAMLLDVGLPGEDGLSMLAWLRGSSGPMRDIPCIIVSSGARPDAGGSGMAALNVVDWMAKPVLDEELLERLNTMVFGDGDGRRVVLHVEDDPDNRALFAHLVRGIAEVRAASTLEEAQRLIRSERFDAVVLDLALPDGHGADLIPGLSRHQTAPVIVYSSMQPPDEVRDHISAALVKTATSERQLIETLRAAIGGNQAAIGAQR